MNWKRVVGFLVARPLIAIALAALVVGLILSLGTHKQTTPVTQRTQHVELTDAQQMQLGEQQYEKTLNEDRANIISFASDHPSDARRIERIEKWQPEAQRAYTPAGA